MGQIQFDNRFLHIICADDKDIFFTDHPFALDFEQYMAYCLKSQTDREIKCICFVKDDLELIFADEESKNYYADNLPAVKSSKLTFNPFRGRNSSAGEAADHNVNALRNIVSVMNKGNTALIITAAALMTIKNKNELRSVFETIKDHKNSNYLIVVMPTDTDGISDILTPKDEMQNIRYAERGILNIKPFKTEMNAFLAKFETGISYWCINNISCLSDKLWFSSDHDYKDYLNMTVYVFITGDVPVSYCVMADWIAAIIYAWHSSLLFRSVSGLDIFKGNKRLKMSEIYKKVTVEKNLGTLYGLAKEVSAQYGSCDDFFAYLGLNGEMPQGKDKGGSLYSPIGYIALETLRRIITCIYKTFSADSTFSKQLTETISKQYPSFFAAEKRLHHMPIRFTEGVAELDDKLGECIGELTNCANDLENNRMGVYDDLMDISVLFDKALEAYCISATADSDELLRKKEEKRVTVACLTMRLINRKMLDKKKEIKYDPSQEKIIKDAYDIAVYSNRSDQINIQYDYLNNNYG